MNELEEMAEGLGEGEATPPHPPLGTGHSVGSFQKDHVGKSIGDLVACLLTRAVQGPVGEVTLKLFTDSSSEVWGCWTPSLPTPLSQ